jgi:hypothetical protein
VTGILMALLALSVDLTRVVAISTFTLVFNYSVANLSSYKLELNGKRQRVIPLIGLATCGLLLILILFVAVDSALIGLVFLAVGAIIFALRKRLTAKN